MRLSKQLAALFIGIQALSLYAAESKTEKTIPDEIPVSYEEAQGAPIPWGRMGRTILREALKDSKDAKDTTLLEVHRHYLTCLISSYAIIDVTREFADMASKDITSAAIEELVLEAPDDVHQDDVTEALEQARDEAYRKSPLYTGTADFSTGFFIGFDSSLLNLAWNTEIAEAMKAAIAAAKEAVEETPIPLDEEQVDPIALDFRRALENDPLEKVGAQAYIGAEKIARRNIEGSVAQIWQEAYKAASSQLSKGYTKIDPSKAGIITVAPLPENNAFWTPFHLVIFEAIDRVRDRIDWILKNASTVKDKDELEAASLNANFRNPGTE